MADPARLLGQALADTPRPGGTVSLQVADVTDDGRVNLQLPDGSLLLDVPCPTSYTNRSAGDWVAVRMSASPVVLWRLGPDPTTAGPAAQAVSALTWGTTTPPGTGWQSVTQLYVRADAAGNGQLYAQVGTVTDPSPVNPGAGTKTIQPTDSGSWRNGAPDPYHSAPSQGDYTGRGNLRGAWFYGTAVADACAGQTVTGMTVTVARQRGSGVNGKRPVHFYLHNYATAPAGQLGLGSGPEELLSLSVGATGTAHLPAVWVSALAAGTARGLAIYASGAGDYLAASGGTLTITYS